MESQRVGHKWATSLSHSKVDSRQSQISPDCEIHYCFPTAVATNYHKQRVLRQSKWAVLQSSCQKSEIGLPGIKPRCQQSHVFSGSSAGDSVLCLAQLYQLPPFLRLCLHLCDCCLHQDIFLTTDPLIFLLWQLLWLQYGVSLKKLKIELPCDPLLGIYPEKTITQTSTDTSMFITAPFII